MPEKIRYIFGRSYIEIIAETENTADYKNGIFGYAEFNLVHKCTDKFFDTVLKCCIFHQLRTLRPLSYDYRITGNQDHRRRCIV